VCCTPHVLFTDPESAKLLARRETVVFAEVMKGAIDERPLEVHVMRPTADGPYEVERDDPGQLGKRGCDFPCSISSR
jgi:hypothetical protein